MPKRKYDDDDEDYVPFSDEDDTDQVYRIKNRKNKVLRESGIKVLSNFPTVTPLFLKTEGHKKRKYSPEGNLPLPQPIPQPPFIVATDYLIDNQWVSGTSVRNYLLKDPLLDWLELYGVKNLSRDIPELRPLLTDLPQRSKSVNSTSLTRAPVKVRSVPSSSSSNQETEFTPFIMEQGNRFEKKVWQLICAKFSSKERVDIGGNHFSARSKPKFNETVRAMRQGIPIIYSGVLHSKNLRYYGVPDLIVRSDYLAQLVGHFPEDKKYLEMPCFWSDGGDLQQRKYHYRIVDIKWTTLLLRSDGTHILNAGSFPCYKAQMLIYNQMLSEIQEYDAPRSYILARKWKFTQKGINYKGNNCFDRLGTIDYYGVDAEIVPRTFEGIEWIRSVRSSGGQWAVSSLPFTRKELYPNMSNAYDFPWRPVKEYLATKNAEISSLWMCGVKQREFAAENYEVYQWTDRRCNVDTLGVTGPSIRPILQKMLQINQCNPIDPVDPLLSIVNVYPPKIKNNIKNWKSQRRLECFVDFETINDVFCNFNTLPVSNEMPNIIFMIGVGYIFSDQPNEWGYRSFIVNSYTHSEEQRICKEYVQFIRSLLQETDDKDTLLFHWSSAEANFWDNAHQNNASDAIWKKKCSRTDADFIERQWFDLLKLFKNTEETIVIRGALGFGLKEVTGALYRLGLLTEKWGASGCQSGTQAMMLGKKALESGRPLTDTAEMKEIEKYNEMDCKVMWEILQYLRKHHI